MLATDFTNPRNACAFTGYVGNITKGKADPSGTLLLCVANTAIPCKMPEQGTSMPKYISFTVVSVLKAGWTYAPW